jgi:hypothetical protein
MKRKVIDEEEIQTRTQGNSPTNVGTKRMGIFGKSSVLKNRIR